jgi:polygalacturonase
MNFKLKMFSVFILLWWLICSLVFAEEEIPGNFKNPTAVQEVLSGKRKVANAAWWGFDSDDSTSALQSVINSGATEIIIPHMGSPWVVRPILLKSNQEIYIEPGVIIDAKKGEFNRTSDSLFRAEDKSNITLRGYGATLKMQKQDYMGPNYEKGQWRMIINLAGCSNIKILGLTLKDSGGDGLYIGKSGSHEFCNNIVVEDCVFDSNYRQGISVIGVNNLRINNCLFQKTSGHPPSAGIDIEPNSKTNRLSDIVIQNCISKNNAGAGFVVSIKHLDANSEDVSILFYNCYIEGCKWGLVIDSEDKDSPKGLIEFRNCFIENSTSPGIWINIDKREFNTVFNNCTLYNCAQDYSFDKIRNSPVRARCGRSIETDSIGSIVFNNLYVFDNSDRPKLSFYFWPNLPDGKSENVSGVVFYNSKQRERILDSNIKIDLKTKLINSN